MLEMLEQAMAFVRKIKLYVDIVTSVAAVLAYALVKATQELMADFAQSGGLLAQSILKEGLLMAVFMMMVLGYGVKVTFLKHRGFQFSDLPIYLFVGIASLVMVFWIFPMVAHFLAVNLIAPASKTLHEFLLGSATVSIKTLLKLLFLVYLVSFVISMLYQTLVLRNDISIAVAKMLYKYWEELLEVLQDLWEFTVSVAKAIFGRTTRHNES